MNGPGDASVKYWAKPMERVIYDAGPTAEWITHGEELMLKKTAEEGKQRQEMERSALKLKKT